MSKLKFEPSDFQDVIRELKEFDWRGPAINALVGIAAQEANRRLNEMLAEQGVQVFGETIKASKQMIWCKEKDTHILVCTHKALLINIESIEKKCEHTMILYSQTNAPISSGKCANCDVKMIAKWEPADE